MRNRILVSIVGVPVLLLTLLVFPLIFTPILVAILSMIASFEISRALGLRHMRIRLYSMLLAAAVPFWAYTGEMPFAAFCTLLLYVVLVFVEALGSRYMVDMTKVGAVFFFCLIAPYFLSSIVRIGATPLRDAYILLPLAIPFLTDSTAMFSGMLFGKHKLAPSISPKKTREGSLGGVIGGVVLTLLYGLVVSMILDVSVNYFYLAIYGLFGSAISQLGDLCFSYIKRQNNLKDFGTIFPGHGGVLDRFDSVIFCAPLVEMLIILLPAFRQG